MPRVGTSCNVWHYLEASKERTPAGKGWPHGKAMVSQSCYWLPLGSNMWAFICEEKHTAWPSCDALKQ